jgi:hypothetical protein
MIKFITLLSLDFKFKEMKYLTNLNLQEVLFLSWIQYMNVSPLDTNGYPNLILEEHKIKLDNAQCKISFKHRIS